MTLQEPFEAVPKSNEATDQTTPSPVRCRMAGGLNWAWPDPEIRPRKRGQQPQRCCPRLIETGRGGWRLDRRAGGVDSVDPVSNLLAGREGFWPAFIGDSAHQPVSRWITLAATTLSDPLATMLDGAAATPTAMKPARTDPITFAAMAPVLVFMASSSSSWPALRTCPRKPVLDRNGHPATNRQPHEYALHNSAKSGIAPAQTVPRRSQRRGTCSPSEWTPTRSTRMKQRGPGHRRPRSRLEPLQVRRPSPCHSPYHDAPEPSLLQQRHL